MDNNPTPSILELACGPGRHAIVISNMGYHVTAMDIDKEMLEAARNNASESGTGKITFEQGNIYQLEKKYKQDSFEGITHGGLMEHFPTEEGIITNLEQQLTIAPYIVFDVPVDTDKNGRLFEQDDIFRNIWKPVYWEKKVLGGFNILKSDVEYHEHPGMTDDLVLVLGR